MRMEWWMEGKRVAINGDRRDNMNSQSYEYS